MRFLSVWLTLLLATAAIPGCDGGATVSSVSTVLENQLVDVSCGQCQFGMDGDGCDLAIRHQGQHYLVSGSDIDDHGDAHAEDGFCNCIRQANVSGAIRDGTFYVSSIDIIDASGAP